MNILNKKQHYDFGGCYAAQIIVRPAHPARSKVSLACCSPGCWRLSFYFNQWRFMPILYSVTGYQAKFMPHA
jgi:hypothetical protein